MQLWMDAFGIRSALNAAPATIYHPLSPRIHCLNSLIPNGFNFFSRYIFKICQIVGSSSLKMRNPIRSGISGSIDPRTLYVPFFQPPSHAMSRLSRVAADGFRVTGFYWLR